MPRQPRTGKLRASESPDSASFTGKNYVQLSFRITPELHQKLKRAAAENRTTVNSELTWRVERTFEQDVVQILQEVAQDIALYWHRHGEGQFTIDRLDELLTALVEHRDAKAKAIAAEILRARAAAARERAEKASRDAAAIEDS